MRSLWFSYSAVSTLDDPEPISSPYTISYHLGRFLRDKANEHGWRFEYRNLDDPRRDEIGVDDIVIGHTLYPDGWVNRALDSFARSKFIIQPYQHFMVSPSEIPWTKALFAKADHLLLITGPYWWDTLPDSPFAEWKEKATRVDMAVNADRHPFSKTTWSKPGKRKFLAIGTDHPYKGMNRIADLFRQCGSHLGYFGDAQFERFADVPQFNHHGGNVFTPDVQAQITKEYDCFITMGVSDANPTTLLETACWGLIPLSNPQSGYWDGEPFVPIRTPDTLEDTLSNLEMIDLLQRKEDYELAALSAQIRAKVAGYYTWQRFTSTVWAELEKAL